MQRLTNRLAGWTSLLLIAHFLVGCANNPVLECPVLPPIYVKHSDLTCMATDTKRQIIQHNCKVDYDPNFCNIKE